MKTLLASLLIFSTVPAFAADESSDKMWNVSTNPLGLLAGVNAKLEYKLTDNIALAPEGSLIFFNLGGLKMNGGSVAVNGKYYFNGTYHTGWYGQGGLGYSSVKAVYTDDNGKKDSASVTTFSIPITAGYHWFWGNFNLALGAGPQINFASTRDVKDETGKDVKRLPGGSVTLAADAAIGWTF